MIEQTAKVTAVETNSIWIIPAAKSHCGSCQSAGGCGLGVFRRFFCNKQAPIQIDTHDYQGRAVAVGDEVVIGIDEKSFLLSSLVVYLLPLVVLIGSSILTTWLLQALNFYYEVLVIVSCVIAMWLTYQKTRQWAVRHAGLAGPGAVLLGPASLNVSL